MSMTRHTETIEVITTDKHRRRWSIEEKSALVRRTYEPGMSVSLVARESGVSAGLLFQWRKLDRQERWWPYQWTNPWCRRSQAQSIVRI